MYSLSNGIVKDPTVSQIFQISPVNNIVVLASSLLTREPNSVLLASLLAELFYLVMIFILQSTHIASSVRQMKNKFKQNKQISVIMVLKRWSLDYVEISEICATESDYYLFEVITFG